METDCQSNSQQTLRRDVEAWEKKKKKSWCYHTVGITLGLGLLSLTLCVFTMKQLWSPAPGKVYELQYKVVLDGVETDSMMEIDPTNRVEVFRMGNGSDEVLEVHDFTNGLTGFRFTKHQRCYIKTQSKELPKLTEEDTDSLGGMADTLSDVQVEDSQVWIPVEEPVADSAFLRSSKIFEICQHLPIHWIHPSPLREVGFHDIEDGEEEPESAFVRVKGHRQTRAVLDHLPVNDYRDIGVELDNRLDDRGYCCQHCRRGYRYCQRYHEPLGGFWPYPYYYQGGRVICQIVMPCNWWIARMLGRV